MGISDLSSDVCSSDLDCGVVLARLRAPARARPGLRPPGGGRAGQPRQPVPNHPGHVPGPDRHLRPEAGPAAPLRARTDVSKDGYAKVPEVTLGFWIIKVLVTTLGETGGDAVTKSMSPGYADGPSSLLALFVAAVEGKVRAERFQPFPSWDAISTAEP